MNVLTWIVSIVVALLGGAGFAAFINGRNERWKFRETRKAKLADDAAVKSDRTEEISDLLDAFKESEKAKNVILDDRIERIEKSSEDVKVAMKLVMLDRILFLGQSYIAKKEISYDDLCRFNAICKQYHECLGGNGDAKIIIDGVNELPLKR